jgi:RimJ/RimL family protein N-acetyltransferase
MNMPVLETARLRIRPFMMEDFEDVYRILDLEEGDRSTERARAARRAWLQWTVLGYEQRAALRQPPYGERAVMVKETGRLVGAVGLVPSYNAFALLPAFRPGSTPPAGHVYSSEVGLFYQIARADRRQGYAAEAARALIDYLFATLHLGRIIATTDYDNAASVAVMGKLGMRIERNPSPDPPWLQVVGVLENPAYPPRPERRTGASPAEVEG